MNSRIDPVFSIVTPSFRMLQWLQLCVPSVADQVGTTVEHIVQDGGTGPECDSWAQEQRGLRYFNEPDAGMYDAINRGIARSRGEVLAYLNCDEQYLPGALERVARFLAENPKVEVVFGDAILVDVHGAPLSYRRVVRPNRVHLRLDHLGTLSCATFFRRSIVDRGLVFDTRLGSIGDAVWVDSILAAGVSTACLPEPLAVYTFTGMNDSETARPARETAEWRQREGGPPKWLRRPATIMHRLEKLAAGAYKRRSVEYAIYTMDSRQERVRFKAPGIHYGWPGATAPPAIGCDKYNGANRTGASNIASA